MARKLKFEEVAQDLAAPITEVPVEADPVEESLQAAEQATAQATEEPAEESQLAEIEQRVLRLEDALARKDEQIRRMSELLTLQAKKLEVLDRNIRRVDAEPVITERVPKSKRQPLEDFDTMLNGQHPAPRYQMATPTHVTERRPDSAGVLPTDDARTAAAKRNMARANLVRGSVGGT